MNAFAIAGLFVLFPCVTVGVFTLLKGRRKIHFVWSAFCFSIALWGFGMYKIATATSVDNSFFWWRIAEIGVILIPLFLTHFVITFLELKRKFLLVAFYIASAIFIFLDLFTKKFIGNLYFAFDQFYYILATPIYIIFICLFVLSVIYALFELSRAYGNNSGIKRHQIRYLMLAFSIGFSGGITSYFPVFRMDVYPVWNVTIFISALMSTYAILRYRLMDLRIVVRKIVIYFVSAAFVYGMFYLVTWIYNRSLGGIYNNGAYLSGLIIAPLFVLLFVWFNNKIKGIANKYLFFSLYSHQETIAKLTDELTNSIDLNKIVDSIVNSIKQAMQLDRAGILLIDQSDGTIKYKIAKVVGFNENNGISLVQDNFLTQYLQKTQKPLVRDELQMIVKDLSDPNERQSFNQLSENMKRIEASLCLPMVISNKLIGIIVLGSKVSGDAYTNEDLDLLSTLSKQAAIAVDNARLYREVQDFSKTLQQKVDEQTKEIREQKEKVEKAYEIEKQAHEELKRTDEVKTQFLVITNHHLRTPLTAINWYTDLLLSGKRGKIPPKSKEIIDRIKTSTAEEIKIVDDLLNVSQFQLDKDMINPRPEVNIEDTLKQIKDGADAEIQQKGIYIKIEKEDKNEIIPLIPADESKLKVAITNVVDNAVKYTEKGGVTITINSKSEIRNPKQIQNSNDQNSKQSILITIQDTGIGMDETELKNIFDKTFQRGEQAQKLFATGKGIGLYISAKIIEAHRGRIWAESGGKGKGSTFYIELPT